MARELKTQTETGTTSWNARRYQFIVDVYI
jgi:hypothetical protein